MSNEVIVIMSNDYNGCIMSNYYIISDYREDLGKRQSIKPASSSHMLTCICARMGRAEQHLRGLCRLASNLANTSA